MPGREIDGFLPCPTTSLEDFVNVLELCFLLSSQCGHVLEKKSIAHTRPHSCLWIERLLANWLI